MAVSDAGWEIWLERLYNLRRDKLAEKARCKFETVRSGSSCVALSLRGLNVSHLSQ